ncbi:MAG: hypothetical protein AAGN64_11660, partial [Bacteroidota bacterium]
WNGDHLTGTERIRHCHVDKGVRACVPERLEHANRILAQGHKSLFQKTNTSKAALPHHHRRGLSAQAQPYTDTI